MLPRDFFAAGNVDQNRSNGMNKQTDGIYRENISDERIIIQTNGIFDLFADDDGVKMNRDMKIFVFGSELLKRIPRDNHRFATVDCYIAEMPSES
jgi:hypothetical protein